jgi:hypothetical protein
MSNEFELSTGAIVDAISPLIAKGRLTGEIYVDGMLVLETDTPSPVTTTSLVYDEYGFSPHNENGCVRIKVIEELLDSWVNSDDEYEREIADTPHPWYGIRVPGREYTAEQGRQLNANAQNLWMIGMGQPVFGKFYVFGDRYKNTQTGETANTLTQAQRYDRAWRLNYDNIEEAIPNHRAIGWGNYMDPNHPNWAEAMKTITETLLKGMKGRPIALRKYANRNPHARLPSFSPRPN